MQKTLFAALILLMTAQIHAQKVYETYTPVKDSLRYGYGQHDVFPCGSKGYTLVLPDSREPVKGTVLVLNDDKINVRDTSRPQEGLIHRQANAKGYAALYISTGIPVDLYFSEQSLVYVDSLIRTVFTQYRLPNKNIFLLGSMVSGHRALKYIEYCKKGKSTFTPAIKGVILSESAIDWVRQWYECQKQVRDHLTPTGFFEGNLITYLFAANLHDTPVTNMQKYIDFSPYSYFDTKMEKPALYKDLAIRAYTYADIRYWFSAQGKGIYDSNYPDMSGFINEQKLVGNTKASLIVFSSGLTDPLPKDMRRQASTWDLVDKNELVTWMTAQSTQF
jgi:hypothetical protein